MGERMAASREGDGIVLAQLRGPASQSGAFGELSRAIGHPAVDLAPEMTPRRHRIGRRVIRVELKRLGEQWQSVVDGLSSSLVYVRHSAQVVVVGAEAFGRFELRGFDLRPLP